MRILTVLSLFLFIFSLACGEKYKEVAILETDAGNIVIRFYEDIAPEHVKNFKVLSRSGYYDGTCFQKIVHGDFIQGGDPNTKDDDPSNDGSGGPGYTIEPELSHLKHRRGIVSMARGKSMNSSGSQFFICLRELPHLDGLFTIFGEVVEGIDVIDIIGSAPSDSMNQTGESVHLRKVTIERQSVF
jgi:cyclophilin family peptidyl-prolyl cis-trans isomerase